MINVLFFWFCTVVIFGYLPYPSVFALLDVPAEKNEVKTGNNSDASQSSSDMIASKMKFRQDTSPDFKFEIFHLKDYVIAVSNNSTSKQSNSPDNTTANLNCTNFEYNVSCRAICKPPQQVCPSQVGPNTTSAYSSLGRPQKN